MRLDLHGRVDAPKRLPREVGLPAADLSERVEGLTVQIARLERIAIDDAEAADAGSGEVLQHRHAEAARADHEHPAALEPGLTLGADFPQEHLSRIIGPHVSRANGGRGNRDRAGAPRRRLRN